MYLKTKTMKSTKDCSEQITKLKQIMADADAVVIGAGSGLSVAAGLSYSGERFQTNFKEFCDTTFVQDAGWYAASNRYEDFIRRHAHLKTVYLELGVGSNTPVIIKYPFWQMTAQNPDATYVCINLGEAVCPHNIKEQSLCINMDIGKAIDLLVDSSVIL